MSGEAEAIGWPEAGDGAFARDEPVGHPTPEEAARGDVPEQLTTVVWCARRADNAVVLLQVSADPEYFDLVPSARTNAQVLHWLSNGSFENY